MLIETCRHASVNLRRSFSRFPLAVDAPPPPAAAASLSEATLKLDLNIILPALKNFIVSQLTRPGTDASASLKSALDWTTHDGEFLSDYEWFDDHFPAGDGLTIATSLACLQHLEKYHKAA